MQTMIRPLASLWSTVREQLRETRDAHAEQVALQRELAAYSSPEDLNDLHAILDRYPDQETANIRRILATQRSN